MFGISGTELVAVIVLALILVGPERLPGYARRLAHVVRDLRRRWQDVRAQVDEDVDRGLRQSGLDETRRDLQAMVADIQDAASPAPRPASPAPHPASRTATPQR